MPPRRSWKLAATLSMAALVAVAPAAAQPDRREDDGRVITITTPQFVVHAVSFRALDETGWDWPGSDEVHFVFANWEPFDERATTVYGNVDSGDAATFRSVDRCIAPLPDCSRGVSRVQFAVAAWEKDSDVGFSGLFGLQKPRRPNSHDMYETGISNGDDLIGRVLVAFSQQQLLGTLPNVGDVVEREIHPTGGSGSYRLIYRITRLPDIRQDIVIGPPRPERIVLQAVLDPPPPGKINLTWTGATAASVDVLRGAALIATTPNDGQHDDRVQTAGTYQYRVCNAGTTACSNTAIVTVP